nr:hypothetical protein CFP56_78302 [Quercus suber]
MAAFKSHLDYDCGALIRSLLLWTAGAEVKSAVHLRTRLQSPTPKLLEIVDTKQLNMIKVASEKIRVPLHERNIQVQVAGETRSIIAKLHAKEWRWNTVRSFVRCRGKNEHSVKPTENWNKDLSRLATSDVVLAAWKGMRHKSDMELIEVEREVRHGLEGIGSALHGDPDTQCLPLSDFIKLVELKTKDLSSKTRSFANEYNKRILTGRGVKQRILNKLQNHVLTEGHASPFAVLGTKITNEIAVCVQECAKQIKQAIEVAVDDIEQNFENMIINRGNANDDLIHRSRVHAFLVEQKIEERFSALLAKRDAIFAKQEYADVIIKQEGNVD